MSHGRSVHQSSRFPPARMTLPGVSGAHWDPSIASFPFLHHRLPHLGAQNHTPPCSHSLVRVQAWCGRAPGQALTELSCPLEVGVLLQPPWSLGQSPAPCRWRPGVLCVGQLSGFSGEQLSQPGHPPSFAPGSSESESRGKWACLTLNPSHSQSLSLSWSQLL